MVHVKLVEEVTIFYFFNFEFIHVNEGSLDLERRFLITTFSRRRLSHGNTVNSAKRGANKCFETVD